MSTSFKHKLINMFREFLLYHSDSLAFRAKLLTLMVLGNGDSINECEKEKLKQISHHLYPDDKSRAGVMLEAIDEFYDKISEKNNLVYDNLIHSINRDIKETPRFVEKIDIKLFGLLKECIEDEDERVFHDRIISYLENLKAEYGEL